MEHACRMGFRTLTWPLAFGAFLSLPRRISRVCRFHQVCLHLLLPGLLLVSSRSTRSCAYHVHCGKSSAGCVAVLAGPVRSQASFIMDPGELSCAVGTGWTHKAVAFRFDVVRPLRVPIGEVARSSLATLSTTLSPTAITHIEPKVLHHPRVGCASCDDALSKHLLCATCKVHSCTRRVCIIGNPDGVWSGICGGSWSEFFR